MTSIPVTHVASCSIGALVKACLGGALSQQISIY